MGGAGGGGSVSVAIGLPPSNGFASAQLIRAVYKAGVDEKKPVLPDPTTIQPVELLDFYYSKLAAGSHTDALAVNGYIAGVGTDLGMTPTGYALQVDVHANPSLEPGKAITLVVDTTPSMANPFNFGGGKSPIDHVSALVDVLRKKHPIHVISSQNNASPVPVDATTSQGDLENLLAPVDGNLPAAIKKVLLNSTSDDVVIVISDGGWAPKLIDGVTTSSTVLAIGMPSTPLGYNDAFLRTLATTTKGKYAFVDGSLGTAPGSDLDDVMNARFAELTQVAADNVTVTVNAKAAYQFLGLTMAASQVQGASITFGATQVFRLLVRGCANAMPTADFDAFVVNGGMPGAKATINANSFELQDLHIRRVDLILEYATALQARDRSRMDQVVALLDTDTELAALLRDQAKAFDALLK
jgi:hypothetical protein